MHAVRAPCGCFADEYRELVGLPLEQDGPKIALMNVS